MINRVVLVGRLTKNPELRYTPNGVAVTTFTIAVDRPFSNQQGEREADFIQVVVWRRQAENVANYLTKGSLTGVEGRIQTRNYENNEGRRVYVTEVVADSVQFLESKSSRRAAGDSYGAPMPTTPPSSGSTNYNGSAPQQGAPSHNQQNPPSIEDPFANDSKPIDISDDDLPF